MASNNRKVLKRMLSNLSKKNFEAFCDELVNREGEPRVSRNKVEDKNYIEITEVLISTFNETEAVKVAEELLREIDCNKEAQQLLKATCGQPSNPGSSDREHFVDKHRVELIDRVHCVEDILDELLQQKVVQQGSYDEICALATSRAQMRMLFSGPLKAAGPAGKEIFYKILEQKEKYLIDDLKGMPNV